LIFIIFSFKYILNLIIGLSKGDHGLDF